MAKKSDELSDAIDDIQKYSYQYNVKLLGVPECNERETAATSTELCVRLFNGMGVEVYKSPRYRYSTSSPAQKCIRYRPETYRL